MLTYQVRKRIIRLESDGPIDFPCEGAIRLYLLPEQPFGESPDGGRTAVRAVSAMVQFDGNTGHHHIKSGKPLSPLEVTIEEAPKRTVSLRGRVLEVHGTFDSYSEFANTIETLAFSVPLLLNVAFADPPFLERIGGELDGISFRWELTDWRIAFATTTQEEQEQAVIDAWLRLDVVNAPHRRRLVAALHYLHVACRLAREGRTAGEFMAEVLLNLSKTLEALFPGEHSIDSAREGLRSLGYDDDEIEAGFIPVIALRNQIDVGHVHLSVFTRSQLTTLHGFVELVEWDFRDLLRRVLKRIEAGDWDVTPYEDPTPRPEALQVIRRMQQAVDAASTSSSPSTPTEV